MPELENSSEIVDNTGGPIVMAQAQFGDPVLTFLLLPLITFNMFIMNLNAMATSMMRPLQANMVPMGAGMPIGVPLAVPPFSQAAPASNMKITGLKRDASGNIIEIIEKW